MRTRRSSMAVAGRALVALLILGAFAGVGVVVDSHSATASSTQAQLIVSDAASQAGVPYCDGGGGINGPSNGGVVETGCGAGVKGFDCMSLVQYAVYQATGIILPDNGTQPEGVGTYIPPAATLAEDEAQVLPGDAVYWGGSGIDGFAHSGIYAGNDEVWDAVGPGIYVQTHTFEYLRETYNYDGAEQYTSEYERCAGDHHHLAAQRLRLQQVQQGDLLGHPHRQRRQRLPTGGRWPRDRIRCRPVSTCTAPPGSSRAGSAPPPAPTPSRSRVSDTKTTTKPPGAALGVPRACRSPSPRKAGSRGAAVTRPVGRRGQCHSTARPTATPEPDHHDDPAQDAAGRRRP